MNSFPFSVISTMSRNDFIRAVKTVQKLRWLPYVFLVCGLVTVFNITASVSKNHGWKIEDIMPLIVGIAVFFLLRKRINNGGQQWDKNPRLQKPIEYTFTDAGIVSGGEGFKTDNDWAVIHKIVLTPDYLVLYRNPGLVEFIKRNLFSGEQLDLLRTKVKVE